MKVLIVKTSSLGDLLHTFPALTDAVKAIKGIEFHWLVESGFEDVPFWHPAVTRIIPIGLRTWRKSFRKAYSSGAFGGFWQDLRQDEYDLIIDAQSLTIKSAIPTWFAKGPSVGYDWDSARDNWSSLFYDERVSVDKKQHAIDRIRQLFSKALNYGYDESTIDYGIELDDVSNELNLEKPYLVFMHSTTWVSKHWPEKYWKKLLSHVNKAGFSVYFPWVTEEEKSRVERIIIASRAGYILPKLSLTKLAAVLDNAAGIVGVDSGLTHIAAGLGTPGVALYGPTTVGLTGAKGPFHINLNAEFECAPCMQRECTYEDDELVAPACFSKLPPETVWLTIQKQMLLPNRSID